MAPEKILWIRELSCGHERPTEIDYVLKKYNRPKRNDNCFCVVCGKNSKIVGVKEGILPERKIIHKIIKHGDIWVYLCNQACSTTLIKSTRENKEVTCINCLTCLKKYGGKE